MAKGDAKMKQLSAKQIETLVNYVYARPEIQKDKLTPTYTKVVANTLWEDVTSALNSIPGGAIKTSTQWNKTWRDLRKNVKNKVSKEKKIRNGTGGGPPMPPPTTESDKTIDEKFFEILTPVAFVISEDITWDINKEVHKQRKQNITLQKNGTQNLEKNNEKFLMIGKQGISSTQDYRQRKL
ncbi:hypothetical protein RN001_008972 [Aquatica leii]|uniref:Regulatory protein zeste n=1 Tax=Aquatica leii TaxID=1421715 RepID=A0AAN7PE22_9COLE|nr:hypothetical protein RN001_008972 [Aquatica leii]